MEVDCPVYKADPGEVCAQITAVKVCARCEAAADTCSSCKLAHQIFTANSKLAKWIYPGAVSSCVWCLFHPVVQILELDVL